MPLVIGKYKGGRYKELPKIVKHYSTRCLKIYFDKPTCINLDGEQVLADMADISLAKEKLRFFYPKGLSMNILPKKEPATV